ncbi:hypothetical protein Tco_0420386 [Tanacetum coccineum]
MFADDLRTSNVPVPIPDHRCLIKLTLFHATTIRFIRRGPERPRVYSELSQEEKDRYNADIRATNIILQGLPKDIYSLINHYIDAKDIWDNVKMLLEGSELTKEDRESQLYDDFEHFRQNKEWGRLLTTAVKLNKGLKDSNFDQLYAYLKQHEAHANENKMMLERLTQQTVDPLALMSNVSHQPYHSQSSTNPPNTYHQPHSGDTSQSDLGISPTENLIENLTNTLALLTQSYKTFLPQTNNQLETSFHPRNPSYVQDGRLIVQNVQGRQNRGQGNSARSRAVTLARNCTQPKRPQNSEYFKDKMLLMQAQENGVILDEEQSLFLAGGLDNAIDEDVMTTCSKNLALNWIMLISLSRMLLDHHDEHEEQRLWSFYDEVNKVAIGYKNPLCLHRARQVQPALYSGHKMHDKMKAKACVDNKVNFTPPNYSKENFLATFSPQKQLTPEQLFWSQDIVKMKAEALKEQNTRPIKALTVYPPNTPATLVPRVLPTKRVSCCTGASGSQPRSILKKHRIPPAKSDSLKKVEDHSRLIRSSLRTTNRVDSSISSKRTVVQIVLWYLDSGCSKHMTGDRSRLMNFVKKFIGTVRFGNDHFGAIMGYGDYVIGDSVISSDSDWRLHSESIRVMFVILEGVEVLKGVPCSNLYTISVEETWKNVLPDLLTIKGLQEQIMVMASAFKPLELRKGYRIYNKRTRQIMETIHVTFDELTEQMAPVQFSSGPAPILLTPGPISSGLVPNPAPAIPFAPPTNKNWIKFAPTITLKLHTSVRKSTYLNLANPPNIIKHVQEWTDSHPLITSLEPSDPNQDIPLPMPASKNMDSLINGRENSLLKWRAQRRSLCSPNRNALLTRTPHQDLIVLKKSTLLVETLAPSAENNGKRMVELYFVRTEVSWRDIFTKSAWPRETIRMSSPRLGMKCMKPETLKVFRDDQESFPLLKRMGELEQHIVDRVEENQALESRLDEQGSRIRKLETMDWSNMIREETTKFIESHEFQGSPTSDMKEILLHPNACLRRKPKKKGKQDSPNLPLGSPLQLTTSSSTTGSWPAGRFWHNRKASDLPSSSSTTSPSHPLFDMKISPQLLQVLSSDDEVGRDHVPTVNLRQSWWKPLTEDRPSTPEPAWTIPSSDLSMPTHNWTSALKSTYATTQENSLLLLKPGYSDILWNWSLEPPITRETKRFLTTASTYGPELCYRHHRGRNFQLGIVEMLPNTTKTSQTSMEAKDLNSSNYTVIDSPRAVTFRDKYGVQMIMRFNEIHKFSDGTLQQIDEALDYRVKRSDTYTGNPVKEILLKINLPDHRSVLTDQEDQAKMEMESPRSSGVNSPPNAHT